MPSGRRSSPLPASAPNPIHPLGCHRPRVPDRLCFVGDLDPAGDRRARGSTSERSWAVVSRHDVAGPPRRVDRRRRVRRARRPRRSPRYDRIIGLDLTECRARRVACTRRPAAVKEPARTPPTGPSLGWKWSVATDRNGIPIGWAIDGANRNDVASWSRPPSTPSPTPRPARRHRDPAPRPRLRLRRRAPTTRRPSGSPTSTSPGAAPTGRAHKKQPIRLGLRWIVEANQHLAVELRPAPPQHRPVHQASPRPALPRRHPHHHRQTDQLGRPMEPSH